MSAYQKLTAHFTQISHYQHLSEICAWDQAAMMPEGGNQARSEALGALSVLIHQHKTNPQLNEWIAQAEQEELSDQEKISLAAIKRRVQQAQQLPEDLVLAQSLANSTCEHAWREQRAQNDWEGFKPNFKKVVELAREEARVRAAATGLSPYDAMVDLYEPGMSSEKISRLFSELISWLPEFIQRANQLQAQKAVVIPQGPFPIPAQKELGLAVMGLLGFDFNHGRLDISSHPFCGGVPADVRITTRYDETDFMKALFGVIHETGHARYEQNLPPQWRHLPVGEARSTGVHESQSLLFEMQLARTKEFVELVAPLAAKHLGRTDDPAFSSENLYGFTTRIKQGFIRVDADELTYPAHVILRYEIERDLINGSIEVDDIPVLWNEKMQAYLGISTEGNYRMGCMQDIHWPCGTFGYFPSYTLGAIYAAQLFAAIKRATPNLAQQIANGDLSQLFAQLNENIWSKASFLNTETLITQATGEPLNVEHFKRHLEQRYLQ